MRDLNGVLMRVVVTAPNGVVGRDTLFVFAQRGAVVEARYSGGRIAAGSLVGLLTGADFSFRYCQVTHDGAIDGGASTGRFECLDDGRLRMTETFNWESRPGQGVNVFEQIV